MGMSSRGCSSSCLKRLASSCRIRSNSSVAAMSSRNMLLLQDFGSNASKDSIICLSFLSKLFAVYCLFSTVYRKASWVITRFLFSVNAPVDSGSFSCLDILLFSARVINCLITAYLRSSSRMCDCSSFFHCHVLDYDAQLAESRH